MRENYRCKLLQNNRLKAELSEGFFGSVLGLLLARNRGCGWKKRKCNTESGLCKWTQPASMLSNVTLLLKLWIFMNKRGKALFAEAHRSAIHLLRSPQLSARAAHFSQPELKSPSCDLFLSLRREQWQSRALNVFQIGRLSGAWSTAGADWRLSACSWNRTGWGWKEDLQVV